MWPLSWGSPCSLLEFLTAGCVGSNRTCLYLQVLQGCLQNRSEPLVLTEFHLHELVQSPPEWTWLPIIHRWRFQQHLQPGVAPLEGPGLRWSVEVQNIFHVGDEEQLIPNENFGLGPFYWRMFLFSPQLTDLGLHARTMWVEPLPAPPPSPHPSKQLL